MIYCTYPVASSIAYYLLGIKWSCEYLGTDADGTYVYMYVNTFSIHHYVKGP